jgi:predicted nucleotide-binding protein
MSNPMQIEWEKIPPGPELDSLGKSLLREIAQHFLLTGTGLPDRAKRMELGKDRHALDSMVGRSLITNIGNKYYPAFAALYYLPPEMRTRFEEATARVLKAFLELFKTGGSSSFSLVQVSDQIARMTSGLLGRDAARVGMLFARDFPNYFGSTFEYSADAPITSASVWENILDFEDLQQAWLEELTRRNPAPPHIKTDPVETKPEVSKMMTNPDKSKRVFVVHGRDERLRSGAFSFLRALGLQPLEWTSAIRLTEKSSPYIGEILDAAFRNAQAVVVLLTPDDEARLRQDLIHTADAAHEKTLTGQARPNVLFEAGMAFASHPDKTVLIQIGEIRPFSDIAGRHVVKMDNSFQKRHEAAIKLRTAGCVVDLEGIDWQAAGDLKPPAQEGVPPSNPHASQGSDTPANERSKLMEHKRIIIAPISRGTSEHEYTLETVDEIGAVIRLPNGTQVRIPKADYLESWDDFLKKPKLILTRKYFQGYFPGHESAEEYFLPR